MPASYSLRIKRSAEKELRRIPKADLRRIVQRMERLATDPRPPGCEKLFGDNVYRVRQGDYRILYAVDDGEGAIEVIKIGHGREVYR
ncbi:MAG TPA: type II toxin-antitoxin system RelE/ParE family toxin [Verrucomicrobiae bacterium]|nr:type II toxin-antitoxin system RelE/ParE family toxin [Verrucomicrobiae bacterium]